jgi:hypothetical protein
MDILAFDLSKSSTGYARYQSDCERITYGSFSLGDSEYRLGDCTVVLFQKIKELCLFDKPDLIVYEEQLNGNRQSNERNNRQANAWAVVVQLYAAWYKIRHYPINNQTLKDSWLMPERKLSRDEAKSASVAMSRRFGLRPKNHDEADAIGLLDYAMLREKITPPWRANEVLRPPLGG